MMILLAILLGFVPSLLWLVFFLKEDVHSEPKKMVTAVYIWGGVSALLALILEYASESFANSFYIELPRLFNLNITPFLLFAIIEEASKFLFVFIIVGKSKYFNEPIDAMVYTATGALGFASVENFLLVLSNGMNGIFSIVLLRFIGATLLHALASTAVGYYWAKGKKYGKSGRFILAGLIMAVFIHFVFNLLVWKFSDLLIYPIAFLAIIGFFIMFDFEELRNEEY